MGSIITQVVQSANGRKRKKRAKDPFGLQGISDCESSGLATINFKNGEIHPNFLTRQLRYNKGYGENTMTTLLNNNYFGSVPSWFRDDTPGNNFFELGIHFGFYHFKNLIAPSEAASKLVDLSALMEGEGTYQERRMSNWLSREFPGLSKLIPENERRSLIEGVQFFYAESLR
jgi:hypothetical protein